MEGPHSSQSPQKFGSLFNFLNDEENEKNMRQQQHDQSRSDEQSSANKSAMQTRSGSRNHLRESKVHLSPPIKSSSPFYCDPSILSTSVSNRKQLRNEDRKNRSHSSVYQAQDTFMSPQKQSHEQQQQQQQQSPIQLFPQNRILLSTYLRAQNPKNFDLTNVDRNTTAPFYGEFSPTKSQKGNNFATQHDTNRNRSGVSPSKSEAPYEPLESLLSGSSEFNNQISYSSLMRNKSAQSSPMKTSVFNKTANYDSVHAKTLTYETFMSKAIKHAEKVERSGRKQLDGVYDNFIEVRLDRTEPVIFGLSQNYRALHVKPPETPEAHDYKRHKMKKSQFLVRSVVKYIEKERQTVHMSNYDKSFLRLKESIAPSNPQGNVYAEEALSHIAELTNTENDIVKMLTSKTKKAADLAREKKQTLRNNHLLVKKSAISEAPDSDDSSSERYKQSKENEQKEKIRKEIISIREKKEKEALQEKFYSQARGAKLLHRQNIITWAKTHQLDELQSIQKYKESINNPDKDTTASSNNNSKRQTKGQKRSNSTNSTATNERRTSKLGNQFASPLKAVHKSVATILPATEGSFGSVISGVTAAANVSGKQVKGKQTIITSSTNNSAITAASMAASQNTQNNNNNYLVSHEEESVEDKADEFQFKSQQIMKRIVELGRQNDAHKAKVFAQRTRFKPHVIVTNSPNTKNIIEGDRISTEGSMLNDDTPSKRRSVSFTLPGPMLQQNSVQSNDSSNAKPSTFKGLSAPNKKGEGVDEKASPTRRQSIVTGTEGNNNGASLQISSTATGSTSVSAGTTHPPKIYYDELEAVIHDIHTGGYS